MVRHYKMVNVSWEGKSVPDETAKKWAIEQIENEHIDKYLIIEVRQGDLPNSKRRFTDITYTTIED